jgi:hypothetical protein
MIGSVSHEKMCQNILPTCEKIVNSTQSDTVIFADSSTEGWDSVMNDLSNKWDKSERTNHNNYLELKAVLLRFNHSAKKCAINIYE